MQETNIIQNDVQLLAIVLTLTQISKITGIPRSSIKKWAHEGKFVSVDLNHELQYFDTESVLKSFPFLNKYYKIAPANIEF